MCHWFKKAYFRRNRGVPCPDLIGTETQAEIIPVESFAYIVSCSFHIPEPGNAGVGKEQSRYLLLYVCDHLAVLSIFSFLIPPMTVLEWLQLLFTQLKETTLIEWLGVGFGIVEVLFAKANKIWLYPCGIISVILSSYIFIISGLYAESLLNGYYLIMSIYGWWFWIKKKNEPSLPVSWCSRRDWIIAASIVLFGFAILYFSLSHFTNSTVPFWDAWVSATAWAGMWQLAKRKIENWILLNISNAFAIPLLFYKHLPLYALLTLFLFIIAIQGFFKWKKAIAVAHKSDEKTTVAFQ